ncbi:MAG: DUF4331 domain-containing protein, partial [Chitinophagaceae bacterium]
MAICLLPQIQAQASSHREAPLISNDPLADNTDLYAFKSPCDSNKIVLIANFIPFEHPGGGPNWYSFGENIRYEIHIDNNTATAGDDIVYRFTFSKTNEDGTTFFNIRLGKQNLKTTYVCERSTNGGASFTTIIASGVVPPPNIGPRSIDNSTVGLGASYTSLMNDFPDSERSEDYKLKVIKSYYLYASNSVDNKKVERFETVISEVNDFVNRFPESKMMSEVENYSAQAQTNIKAIQNE